MQPFTLFRFDNPTSYQGLWYDRNGNFNPFIHKLKNAKCRDMPMEFDPVYKEGGKAWISACDNKFDLKHWITHDDMLELSQAGYNLYELKVSGYRQTHGHAIFTRESVIESHIIDFGFLKQ